MLKCVRELHKRSNRFAVAVQKEETVVGGYFPIGGSIVSIVNGPRCYSCNWEKRGLEVPCIYTLSYKGKHCEFMDKTKEQLGGLKAVTTEIIANTSENKQKAHGYNR